MHRRAFKQSERVPGSCRREGQGLENLAAVALTAAPRIERTGKISGFGGRAHNKGFFLVGNRAATGLTRFAQEHTLGGLRLCGRATRRSDHRVAVGHGNATHKQQTEKPEQTAMLHALILTRRKVWNFIDFVKKISVPPIVTARIRRSPYGARPHEMPRSGLRRVSHCATMRSCLLSPRRSRGAPA